VLTSTAMRRALRPQARLMRSLALDTTATPQNLLARVNAGEVSAAPPKTVPPDAATVDEAAETVEPKGVPRWLLDLVSRNPWLPLAVIALGILVLVALLFVSLALGLAVGLPLLAVLVVLAVLLRRLQRAHDRALSLSEAGQTPEAVDRLPESPDFVLS